MAVSRMPGLGMVEKKPWRTRVKWYWPIAAAIVVIGLIVMAFPSNSPSSTISHLSTSNLGLRFAQQPGQTVNGTQCGPGVRQVSWSNYAPYCEPAYTGSNGGATSPGVTGNTITVTYREPSPTATALFQASYPEKLTGTLQQSVSTMQAYVNLFNKSYELYGRHVVLKPFPAQGDFVTELQDQGLEQAQADALTAKQDNAFADVSLLDNTQPYDQYLADQKIIAIGAISEPQSWFNQFSPYEYSPVLNCTTGVKALVTGIGRSMAKLPAIWAGDPNLRNQTRRFGLIFPENPTYAQCGNQFIQGLKSKYGVSIARTVEYSISIADEQQEATNTIAQMKAHGVTTVLCGCDPIFPRLLMQDAINQNYYPEWGSLDYEDFFNQGIPVTEMGHAITAGAIPPPTTQEEAYKAYQLSGASMQDMSPQFAYIYQPILLLFNALQAAGPDLNPSTFESGFFNLPPSLPGGDFGKWAYGYDIFDPIADFEILYWDPTATSPEDGALGTYVGCNGGKKYSMSVQGASQLPMGRQLSCFGAG